MAEHVPTSARRWARKGAIALGVVVVGYAFLLLVTQTNYFYSPGASGDRGGYITLDGNNLVLSPAGLISVDVVGAAGGFDWCGSDFSAEEKNRSTGPDVQRVLYDHCPREADVERAGVVRPAWWVWNTVGGASTSADRSTMRALWLAQILSIVIGAAAFAMIARGAFQRRAFETTTVRWLRVCAVCLGIGAIVVPILTHRFEQMLADRFTPQLPDVTGNSSLFEPLSGYPGPWTYLLVAAVLVLAQVWRRAGALQRDAEATV